MESVAPIFKMTVQSKISINKDKMVLLFLRMRTKNMSNRFVKKMFKTLDMVKCNFAWRVVSVAPW